MKIKIATKKDAIKINRLRKSAYRVATNTQINDFSFLEWNEDDDKALVVYIENDEGVPISSFRGVSITTKSELEHRLDIRIHEEIEYPVFMMDKLVTAVTSRGVGLSAVLRYFFIQYSNSQDIKNIVATINNGTSRIPILQKMGYNLQFADTNHRKKSAFKNSSRVILATLPQKNFLMALDIQEQALKLKWHTFDIAPQLLTMLNLEIMTAKKMNGCSSNQ